MHVLWRYFDRLQAKKDDDEGEFSPEVTCDMPCSVPSTPNQPHLGGKTKTSFTIKWTVSICNYYNEPSLYMYIYLQCTLHFTIKIPLFHFLWKCGGLTVSAHG